MMFSVDCLLKVMIEKIIWYKVKHLNVHFACWIYFEHCTYVSLNSLDKVKFIITSHGNRLNLYFLIKRDSLISYNNDTRVRLKVILLGVTIGWHFNKTSHSTTSLHSYILHIFKANTFISYICLSGVYRLLF